MNYVVKNDSVKFWTLISSDSFICVHLDKVRKQLLFANSSLMFQFQWILYIKLQLVVSQDLKVIPSLPHLNSAYNSCLWPCFFRVIQNIVRNRKCNETVRFWLVCCIDIVENTHVLHFVVQMSNFSLRLSEW